MLVLAGASSQVTSTAVTDTLSYQLFNTKLIITLITNIMHRNIRFRRRTAYSSVEHPKKSILVNYTTVRSSEHIPSL
jgi:hypothetical protein